MYVGYFWLGIIVYFYHNFSTVFLVPLMMTLVYLHLLFPCIKILMSIILKCNSDSTLIKEVIDSITAALWHEQSLTLHNSTQ